MEFPKMRNLPYSEYLAETKINFQKLNKFILLSFKRKKSFKSKQLLLNFKIKIKKLLFLQLLSLRECIEKRLGSILYHNVQTLNQVSPFFGYYLCLIQRKIDKLYVYTCKFIIQKPNFLQKYHILMIYDTKKAFFVFYVSILKL